MKDPFNASLQAIKNAPYVQKPIRIKKEKPLNKKISDRMMKALIAMENVDLK